MNKETAVNNASSGPYIHSDEQVWKELGGGVRRELLIY